MKSFEDKITSYYMQAGNAQGLMEAVDFMIGANNANRFTRKQLALELLKMAQKSVNKADKLNKKI